jgi:hypothetical protein
MTVPVTWDALMGTLNQLTIKNPLAGARELIVETDVWPYPLTGLLTSEQWDNSELANAPVRLCDAKARFITAELAETDVKEGERIIDGDNIYIILSIEKDNYGMSYLLLRRFAE